MSITLFFIQHFSKPISSFENILVFSLQNFTYITKTTYVTDCECETFLRENKSVLLLRPRY